MVPSSILSQTSHDPDLEAQTTSNGSEGRLRASKASGADSYEAVSHHDLVEPNESPSPSGGSGVNKGGSGNNDAPGSANSTAPPTSEWEPWRVGDLYQTKVPRDERAKEEWVKAMKEFDDGICKGWKDQIDTLIIFAGLFSATVTAFTIESYQWLNETPADILARLQLRDLLNATRDPAIDRLAPATFTVSSSSVLINALWFASLTITLAAVVISILCKQWLHEYQRYDNLTVEETFLIHGLRYRGLQAWRVPAIIASLPVLLQTALVLFLVGLLVLLWPLQRIVACIVTIIVQITFLFLGITTILPTIQYIYPKFKTQCAYKSSQSWSVFFIFAFWLFDFSMFATWVSFDRWEIKCIHNGMGHTLSRAYELLSGSSDSFWSIYSFLADTSLKPKIKADLSLLPDFIDGLDGSRRDIIVKVVSQVGDDSYVPQRLEQLKEYIHTCCDSRRGIGRLKPAFDILRGFKSNFERHDTTSYAYQLRRQKMFIQFLESDIHFSNSVIFNRYVEHRARCIDDGSDNMKEGGPWRIDDIMELIHRAGQEIEWDPVIASHLVKVYSHLLKADRSFDTTMSTPLVAYAGFVGSHRRHNYTPSPLSLLKDIQDWISRMPGIDTKVNNAEVVLLRLVHEKDLFIEGSQASDLEKYHLRSFAQFFVDLYETEDVVREHKKQWTAEHTEPALTILRQYLAPN